MLDAPRAQFIPLQSQLLRGWLTSMGDGQLSLLYAAAAISLLLALALAAWVLWRPGRRVWLRSGGLAIFLFLSVASLMLLLSAAPAHSRWWLSPSEAWRALVLLWNAQSQSADGLTLFGRADLLKLLASALAVGLLVMVVALAVYPRRGLARALAWAAGGMLMLPSGLHFASIHAMLDERNRLADAGVARFDIKCQQAGFRRIREVIAEPGIRLTRIRAGATEARFDDRLWPDAGIPSDRVGEAYITSFMDFDFNHEALPSRWNRIPGLGDAALASFQYVDVELAGGGHVRYRQAPEGERQRWHVEPIPDDQLARYAVRYEPDDTTDDRALWIAGTKVSVTDTQTGVLMGELRAYAYAPPMRGGGERNRRSWQHVLTCPAYAENPGVLVRMFVEQVVQPPRR